MTTLFKKRCFMKHLPIPDLIWWKGKDMWLDKHTFFTILNHQNSLCSEDTWAQRAGWYTGSPTIALLFQKAQKDIVDVETVSSTAGYLPPTKMM